MVEQASTEEVRFGVILNGGVSLAVWMGGTVLELDRLIKALAQRELMNVFDEKNVWSALDRLADRRGVRRMTGSKARRHAVRWGEALLRSTLPMLVLVLVVGALARHGGGAERALQVVVPGSGIPGIVQIRSRNL